MIDRDCANGNYVCIKRNLPADFTGSHRYIDMHFQDTMTIWHVHGPHDLVVNFACHPKGPEVADALGLGPEVADALGPGPG